MVVNKFIFILKKSEFFTYIECDHILNSASFIENLHHDPVAFYNINFFAFVAVLLLFSD